MVKASMHITNFVGAGVTAEQADLYRISVDVSPAFAFKDGSALNFSYPGTTEIINGSATIPNMETEYLGNPLPWAINVTIEPKAGGQSPTYRHLKTFPEGTIEGATVEFVDMIDTEVVTVPEFGPSWAEEARVAAVASAAARDGAQTAESGALIAAGEAAASAAQVPELIEAAVVEMSPITSIEALVTHDPDGCLVFVTVPEPAPLPLGAPTLTALVPGKNQAAATWTAPSTLDPLAPITDYSVRYRIVGTGSWNYFAHTASTALTRTITGLANGAANNYEVQVAAVNAAGIGAYSASLTAIPGAVNGTVFSHTGAVDAAELVGTMPTVGPEAWIGTAGNWEITGGKISGKSTAAGNLETVNTGAYGLVTLTDTLNIETLAAATAISSRMYVKYIDSSNYAYLSVGVNTSGTCSFSFVCLSAGVTITNTFGMPAGAIPAATAAANYAVTITQLTPTTYSVTIGSTTRTVTLASDPGLAGSSRIGITTNTTRVKHSNLTVAVNGYYN